MNKRFKYSCSSIISYLILQIQGGLDKFCYIRVDSYRNMNHFGTIQSEWTRYWQLAFWDVRVLFRILRVIYNNFQGRRHGCQWPITRSRLQTDCSQPSRECLAIFLFSLRHKYVSDKYINTKYNTTCQSFFLSKVLFILSQKQHKRI